MASDPNNTTPGNINWKDVCKLKKFGGLDMEDIDKWNEAAVGKLAWHISMLHEFL